LVTRENEKTSAMSFELIAQAAECDLQLAGEHTEAFEFRDRFVNLIQPLAQDGQRPEVVTACGPSPPLTTRTAAKNDILSKLAHAPSPSLRLLKDFLALFLWKSQHRSNVTRRDVTERPDTRQPDHGYVDADRLVERRSTEWAILALSEAPDRVILVAPSIAPDRGIASEELAQDQLADRQRPFDASPAIDFPELGDDIVEKLRLRYSARGSLRRQRFPTKRAGLTRSHTRPHTLETISQADYFRERL
jgi:hypothetical protein